MRLDFQKYDEISRMEYIIESIINRYDLSKILISLDKEESQRKMILTLISILYKQKCYHEYVKEHIIDDDETDNIEKIYEIIDILEKDLEEKNIITATRRINENGIIIQIFLGMYFSKKNMNYIKNKHYMQLVIDQDNQKELLSYNPYTINQILEYMQKPLTKEETIIADLIGYNIESEQTFIKKNEILTFVKEIMKQNYKGTKLDDAIAFVLSNVYQEVMDNYNDENRKLIKDMVENATLKKQEIIDHFKTNDSFSNMILNKFFLYNNKIEEGHLKELETRETKKYAKKIYDK